MEYVEYKAIENLVTIVSKVWYIVAIEQSTETTTIHFSDRILSARWRTGRGMVRIIQQLKQSIQSVLWVHSLFHSPIILGQEKFQGVSV